ncbi:Crp/Fnr family transcriptional regulator [Dyella silvae]|uniref:Crp/Fnr family transcriptional regulator n=1 Tax=Dyella silvae TaxID=2994424 RepID=UPI0022646A3A|nr:Crp/Fnr family transcriptional regulator [Dyella silvae]
MTYFENSILTIPTARPTHQSRTPCELAGGESCAVASECMAIETPRCIPNASRAKQLELAAAAFRRFEWIDALDPSTIELFLREGKLQFVERDQVITRRGDKFDYLWIVLSGAIEVSIVSPEARKQIASFISHGEFINLVPYLDGGVVAYDAIARTDGLLLAVTRNTAETARATDPGLTRLLIDKLCYRARKVYQLLPDHSLLSLRKRCMMTLLYLADTFGLDTGKGKFIGLKVSQGELADVVGCSRPKLNLEIKELEREGLIEIFYSRIRILDHPRLLALAME